MTMNPDLMRELDQIQDPQKLLGELFRRFGDRCAIGTSGQLTGVVLIDLAVKAGVRPRVFTVDSLRLFPETYELMDTLEKKYNISIERAQPDKTRLNAMVREYGEYLFFDSKKRQELCCQIRKVEPNEKVLATLDVWITGLRTDQSRARSTVPRMQMMERKDQGPLLKVAPLIHWKEEELWKYIKENDVPYHKLLKKEKGDWYYESLGCIICTTPQSPDEPRRAGRWRWFNELGGDKECGIHIEHRDEA